MGDDGNNAGGLESVLKNKWGCWNKQRGVGKYNTCILQIAIYED